MGSTNAKGHLDLAAQCADRAMRLLSQGANAYAEGARAWVRTGELHLKLAEMKRNDGSL